MEDYQLANFLLFVVDAAIGAFIAIIILGIVQKKMFALGRFYILANEKSQYWQVIIGYSIFISALIYVRFCEFPARLFPYLMN